MTSFVASREHTTNYAAAYPYKLRYESHQTGS